MSILRGKGEEEEKTKIESGITYREVYGIKHVSSRKGLEKV